MAKRYTRQEVLARLRAEIERGQPLVMTGAGSGICAKFIERGGVDLLGVYNTGYFRMQGYGSLAGMLPMADANQMVYDMGRREVLPQVRGDAGDRRDLPGWTCCATCRCFSKTAGGSVFPASTTSPRWPGSTANSAARSKEPGLGYEHEINLLNAARRLDMLTIGYAFNEEDTRRLMAEAAPDIFIFHAGITRGGSTGYGGGSAIEETAQRSQKHFAIARQLKPDVILLAHGAALSEPEDAQFMVDHTAATAFNSVRASSGWPSSSPCSSGPPRSRRFGAEERRLCFSITYARCQPP